MRSAGDGEFIGQSFFILNMPMAETVDMHVAWVLFAALAVSFGCFFAWPAWRYSQVAARRALESPRATHAPHTHLSRDALTW